MAEADWRSTPAAATAHTMAGGAGPRAVNRASTAPMAAARAYFAALAPPGRTEYRHVATTFQGTPNAFRETLERVPLKV